MVVAAACWRTTSTTFVGKGTRCGSGPPLLAARGVNAIDADQQVRPLPLRFPRKDWAPLPPWFVVADRLRAMNHHLAVVAPEIDAYDAGRRVLQRVSAASRDGPGSRVKAPSVLYLGEPYRWLYEASPTWPWAANAASGRRRWTAVPDRRAWAKQVTAEVDAASGYDAHPGQLAL